MKKRQILCAIVFGSMLAITGCGDDESSGGSAGSAGSNGGGPSNSTCEAICSSDCAFGGVDPGGNYETCVAQCDSALPNFNDDCGPEADAMMTCIEATGCDPGETDCLTEGEAWGLCIADIF
jgi:hypothetical protein